VYIRKAQNKITRREKTRGHLRPMPNSHFQVEVPVQQFTGLVFKVGNERAKGPDAGHSPIPSVFNTEPRQRFLRARMQAATAPFQEAVVTGSGSASGA
jgi:hypothetical protein